MTTEQIDNILYYIKNPRNNKITRNLIDKTQNLLRHLNPELLYFIHPSFIVTKDMKIWGGTSCLEYIHLPPVNFGVEEDGYRLLVPSCPQSQWNVKTGNLPPKDFAEIYYIVFKNVCDNYDKNIRPRYPLYNKI